jgi:hypothetical protein
VHHFRASFVEVLGFAHVRLADYGVVFVYRGIAVAAEAILLCQHARINCAVLLVVAGDDKDSRQGFRLRLLAHKKRVT